MERKRLRVDGIPTDIPVERAKDKLTIHFLRTRNGGGEVEDIEMVSGPPLHAIITFEDDKVIENVLKVKDHDLKIKDKTYNLRVSKLSGTFKLDEILKKASISVNYEILPDKLEYMKFLRKTYKELKFKFDENSKICEISGSYTKIKSVIQEIINKCGLKEDSSDTQSQADQAPCRKQLVYPAVPQVGDHTSLGQYASYEQASFFPREENTEQLQEPFVWDSDIFRYMQKFHCPQYREILNKCNVQALEESSDEITTIILQPLHGDKDGVTNLRDAKINLMGLYQVLEQCLRKEQIDKRDWDGIEDIYRTLLKELKILFPKVLCHGNDQYLFLIGSSADVALCKQHIIDSQLMLNNPTGSLNTYDRQTTKDQLNIAGGHTDLRSLSFKLDNNESTEASRAAAMYSPPPDSKSFLSHLDEKYLSPNSNIHNNDLHRSPGSNKTIDHAILAPINTAEDCSVSQGNEKSGSKGLAQIRKMDVLSALKTGRVDISKSYTKSVGKMQPLRISKASSEFAFSGLVDIVPQSFDFKPAEVKLRRSNSFSNFSAKDTSEHQDETAQFKEEFSMEDWLWHYIKEFHTSDIDTWCAEVTLKEERHKESTVLKLKANNKSKLWSVMKCILQMCKEKRSTLNKRCFQYSILGVKGPDDTAAIKQWSTIFQNCSKELCIKLEKEKMLLIYPKVAEKRVEEYSKLVERVFKFIDTSSLVSGAHSSLVPVIKEQEKELEYSGQQETTNYVKYLDKNYLESLDLRSTYIKYLEDQTKILVSGKNKGFPEDNASSRSFNPALQTQDFLLKELNRPKSKSCDLENFQADVYGSSLAPTMDSSSDFTEKRRPAIGQESDPVNRVCDHCKNVGRVSSLACGHFLCDDCYSAFKDSCCVCLDLAHGNKSSLNATMTYSKMSLTLQGYERYSCFKIKYEVPDGIQGAGDPHPGKPYTGGIFEAYLPDNSEGKKLLSLLEKALNQNLTFKVKMMEHKDSVSWHKIPHKTSTTGGIAKKGYPDSQYIKNTLETLKALGIE